MEFYYKKTQIHNVAGSIWLSAAIMQLGLIVFGMTTPALGMGMALVPIIIAAGSIAVSVFHFRINSVQYIHIDQKKLFIHKAIILPRKSIDLFDIEEGIMSSGKLILILRNGNEVDLNLQLLKVKDCEKLKQKLETYFPIRLSWDAGTGELYPG